MLCVRGDGESWRMSTRPYQLQGDKTVPSALATGLDSAIRDRFQKPVVICEKISQTKNAADQKLTQQHILHTQN